MRPVRFVPAIGVVLVWSTAVVQAEPAWTRDGNCQACHSAPFTGSMSVFGNDGQVNPNGHGLFKVFRAGRNQTKSLWAGVSGLAAGDKYAFGLKGFRYGGLISGAALSYSADCDWANWGGAPGTYSYDDFFLDWSTGPTQISYDVRPGSAAIYDYYELIFMVAGRSSAGDLFYTEEHVYLQVTAPNTPPIVSITSPFEGAVFVPAPIDISISANASDPGGSVAKVEFYSGSTKIGEDTTAPYSLLWPQVAKGSYTLTAKAIDDGGLTTTSTAVHITVNGISGDFDGDGDIDQSDYAHIQICLASLPPLPAGCSDAEFTNDNLIDDRDMGLFLRCMSGADVPANPTCLN